MEQEIWTKKRKGILTESEYAIWSRVYENPRVMELQGKREVGQTVATLCAIAFGVGIIQLWVDLTFLILLFTPIGIIVGIVEYRNSQKEIAKEIERRWEIEKEKRQKENSKRTKKAEQDPFDYDDEF